MTDTETLSKAAMAYVKTNARELVYAYADPEKILPDRTPVSVFMAGSPGAGKTEFSKRLIEELFSDGRGRVVRIDPDEVRKLLPGYTGSNAHIFQGAVSVAVDKIHDHVLRHNQNFILDGTLSDFERAKHNIERSLEKQRTVFIFYIYQDPIIAWQFTQRRELKEGRRVAVKKYCV